MAAPGSQLLVLDSVALASWVENWYPTPVTEDGYTQAAASAPGTTRFHLPPGWRALSNGTADSDNVEGDPAGCTLVRRGTLHRRPGAEPAAVTSPCTCSAPRRARRGTRPAR